MDTITQVKKSITNLEEQVENLQNQLKDLDFSITQVPTHPVSNQPYPTPGITPTAGIIPTPIATGVSFEMKVDKKKLNNINSPISIEVVNRNNSSETLTIEVKDWTKEKVFYHSTQQKNKKKDIKMRK